MRRIVETSKQIWISTLTLLLLATLAHGQNGSSSKNPQPNRQIVVSIPDRELALLEDGRTLKIYSVAVGATDSPSPEGDFKIINRLEKPTYYKPGTIIAPGAANPLGTRWIGLSQRGFGIHGTNVPKSIGKAASHGCIRMRQSDLEELFTMIRVGDTVSIHSERDQQLARVFAPESATDADADQTTDLSEASSQSDDSSSTGTQK